MISLRVPAMLYSTFKQRVAEEGKTITGQIIDSMREYCEQEPESKDGRYPKVRVGQKFPIPEDAAEKCPVCGSGPPEYVYEVLSAYCMACKVLLSIEKRQGKIEVFSTTYKGPSLVR